MVQGAGGASPEGNLEPVGFKSSAGTRRVEPLVPSTWRFMLLIHQVKLHLYPTYQPLKRPNIDIVWVIGAVRSG